MKEIMSYRNINKSTVYDVEIKFEHFQNKYEKIFSCAPDSAEGTGSSGLLVFPVLSGPPPPHVHSVGGR